MLQSFTQAWGMIGGKGGLSQAGGLGYPEIMSTHTASTEATGYVPVITEHIVLTPGVCGGKPRIAGHRIKVAQVAVWYERARLSAAEIVAQHPGLTLADVYAALAYYHDHRDEIDADIRAGEEMYERLAGQQPSLLDKLAAKRPDVLALSNAAALAYLRSGRCTAEEIERLQEDLPRRLEISPEEPDLAELKEELARGPKA
jgi:uncharacterized protein (DUF433 family)